MNATPTTTHAGAAAPAPAWAAAPAGTQQALQAVQHQDLHACPDAGGSGETASSAKAHHAAPLACATGHAAAQADRPGAGSVDSAGSDSLDLPGTTVDGLQFHPHFLGAELGGVQADLRALAARQATAWEQLQQPFAGDPVALAAERQQAMVVALRQSHDKLSKGLTQLNERLDRFKQRLQAERKAREAQDASLQQSLQALQLLQESEQALQHSLVSLQRQWLRRLSWAGGALLALQLATWAYVATRMAS